MTKILIIVLGIIAANIAYADREYRYAQHRHWLDEYPDYYRHRHHYYNGPARNAVGVAEDVAEDSVTAAAVATEGAVDAAEDATAGAVGTVGAILGH